MGADAPEPAGAAVATEFICFRFDPRAENLHLAERFTRVAENEIRYEVTMDDPTTWTRPWTVMVRLYASREPMYEYACHEGNQFVTAGILSGPR